MPSIWSGAEVRVPFTERAPLEPGEFFQSDLVGCEVVERGTGQSLGRVSEWQDGGGSGLLAVGNLLIPFARAICVAIDPAARRIEVELPDGSEGIEPAVNFHVLTIFPEFFAGPFAHGVVTRARDAGLLEIRIHNLRDWTHDRHKTVDDRPFGGGEGMVLKPEPIFEAVESIWPRPPAAAAQTGDAGAGHGGPDGRKVASLRAGQAVRPGDGEPAEPGMPSCC